MLMMMRADKGYTPNEKCSLEEMVACALAEDTDACLAACTGNEEGEEEPANPGYITVSTKAAADQNVALNAVDKKVGTLTLKAGENDSTVTNVEITKAGLWAKEDIANIQLMKDGEYVTNQGTLNGNNVAKLRFRPNVTVKAGKSETFDVVVSMAGSWNAQPNGTHTFSVTSITVANGKFSWTPAKLGSLTTTNYLVSALEADLNSSSYSVNAGDENVEIAKITIKPEAKATVSAVTLTSDEDELDKAFANAKAYIDDEVVGKVTINDETILINGFSKEIEKNKTLDIAVKADVIYVWSGKTFQLSMEDNHVTAIENNTNERMPATMKAGSTGSVAVAWIDLTIEKVIKDKQTVAPWTDDVVFLDLMVKSSKDLDITNYYVDFTNFADLDTFEESGVVLYVDGIDYTVKKADLDSSSKYTLSTKYDYFTVSAKDSVEIKVTWTPTTTWSNLKLGFGIHEVKNIENNKVITLSQDETKEGHITNVEIGWVTITKWTVPSGNTLEIWEEHEVLFFDVKSSSEDIILSGLDVTYDVASLSGIVDEVVLLQWTKKLVTLDEEDLETLTSPIHFTWLNTKISKWQTLPFTLKISLKDGEVTTLWTTFKFTLDVSATSAVRADDKTMAAQIKSTADIEWREYYIATTTPTFSIEKDNENILVTINNGATYDIQLSWFDIKIANNVIGNEWGTVNWATSGWRVLDAKWGSEIASWAAWQSIPGTININSFLAWYNEISANSSATFVIEIDSTVNVLSDYYTASEKQIIFKYVDDGTPSHDVTANY